MDAVLGITVDDVNTTQHKREERPGAHDLREGNWQFWHVHIQPLMTNDQTTWV